MKLLFLHGAPATGKLTIARAILGSMRGRLFDNHSAIDLARTVFDFGAPGFWELVHAARLAVLKAAAERDVSLVVTTYCYAEPDDRLAVEQIADLVESRGGALLPVFLQCSEHEIVRRLGNADRSSRGKVTSRKGLDEFLERFHICPVPRPDCLMVDTSSEAAENTARRIISHFNLDTASHA
jgi:hypothetical protein